MTNRVRFGTVTFPEPDLEKCAQTLELGTLEEHFEVETSRDSGTQTLVWFFLALNL